MMWYLSNVSVQMLVVKVLMKVASGGSRISHGGGGMHPLGGGVDLRRGHFSVKMYAKTKELVPIGGGMCLASPPIRQW